MILALALAAALAAPLAAPGATAATTPPDVRVQDGLILSRQGAPVYVFAHDTMVGMSHCFGACAQDYPPLIASADAKPVGAWTLVPRGAGVQQWAYRDKPLYTASKPVSEAGAGGASWTRATVGGSADVGMGGGRMLGGGMGGPGMAGNGPNGARFTCEGGRKLVARFDDKAETPTVMVDAGDGPHALTLAPWRGGQPNVTWSDGVRTLVWTTGVTLAWSDASGRMMCGRDEPRRGGGRPGA